MIERQKVFNRSSERIKFKNDSLTRENTSSQETAAGKAELSKHRTYYKASKTKTQSFLVLKSAQRWFTNLAFHTMFIAFRSKCDIT